MLNAPYPHSLLSLCLLLTIVAPTGCDTQDVDFDDDLIDDDLVERAAAVSVGLDDEVPLEDQPEAAWVLIAPEPCTAMTDTKTVKGAIQCKAGPGFICDAYDGDPWDNQCTVVDCSPEGVLRSCGGIINLETGACTYAGPVADCLTE